MGLARLILRFALKDAVDAAAEAEAERRKQDPTWYWFTRGLVLLVLVVGWVFIFWQNKFHIDAPVVVVSLGYFAVVMALANLYRVGAAAVLPEHAGEQAWSRPLGRRGELEKEKKTLLKAIKDAEFDHEMRKLSKDDADHLIRMYRARAIELIKELDRLDVEDQGKPASAREAIEREVAARIAIEEGKAKGKKKAKQKSEAAKPAAADKKPAAADKKPAAADKKPTNAAPKPSAEEKKQMVSDPSSAADDGTDDEKLVSDPSSAAEDQTGEQMVSDTNSSNDEAESAKQMVSDTNSSNDEAEAAKQMVSDTSSKEVAS